jgi:hypothetical protein
MTLLPPLQKVVRSRGSEPGEVDSPASRHPETELSDLKVKI